MRAILFVVVLLVCAPSTAAYSATLAARGSTHVVPAAAAAERSGRPVALTRQTFQADLSDALMKRSVEMQATAYHIIHNVACRTWLMTTWQNFLDDRHHKKGDLSEFLDIVDEADLDRVFVPTRTFRTLSPNNPHAAKVRKGKLHEIHPHKVAQLLVTCRKSVTQRWVDQLKRLSAVLGERAQGGAASLEKGEDSESRTDVQLVCAMATRHALDQMLAELSHLPSQRGLHEWLSSFCLRTHARDLSREGDVEALLADLRAQPLAVKGTSLIDPVGLHDELMRRTAESSGAMAQHLLEVVLPAELMEAEAKKLPLSATAPGAQSVHFLEACFRL